MATLTTSYQLLAEKYLGNSYGNLYVRLYAKYSEQDIANNRSYVYYEARTYYSGSTYIYDQQGTMGVSGTGASYNGGACTRPTTGETISYTTSGWVSHNSDGTRSVEGSASLNFPNWGWSGTASATADLPSIPRQANITSAPNFNDEENPIISYSNPAGNSVSLLQACISLTGSTDDIAYRNISKTGSSYTFNLTAAERTTLRNATLNGSPTRNVIFHIKTVIGGNTFYSTSTRTLTIVNANPTVSATMDVDHETYVLTHSHNTIIKDFTAASVTPTATALKGASITSITVNGTPLTGQDVVVIGKDKIDIVATDNRGLSTTLTWVGGTDYTFINYIPLTFSGTVKRHSPTSDQLDLSFSGNYFNGSFGYETNSLNMSWSWREKGSSGNFTFGGNFTLNTDFVINNNTYHSGTGGYPSNLSLGSIFDYRKSYEIKITCFDEITDVTVPLIGLKGIPIINWGKDFFNVNGDILKNGQPLDSGDTLPVGSIVEYDGNTVPEGYEEVQPSACRMWTGDYQTFTQSRANVSVFSGGFAYGDYSYDTTNNYIVIRNTTICEISGAFGGGDYAWARQEISDGTTNVDSFPTLIQPTGNNYFFSPLQTVLITLDPTKTYYLYMTCAAYNVSSFTLNAGFGVNSTWLSAKKIK